MKRLRTQILMGLGLMALSAALYLVQIRLFHDERDTFFYLFQDLAFIPIQVLLVSVIVDQVLRVREKLAKLNMVIGTFFSEAGTKLLKYFAAFDHHSDQISRNLLVTKDWTDQKFAQVSREAVRLQFRLDHSRQDLGDSGSFSPGSAIFCCVFSKIRTCSNMRHSPTCSGLFFIWPRSWRRGKTSPG